MPAAGIERTTNTSMLQIVGSQVQRQSASQRTCRSRFPMTATNRGASTPLSPHSAPLHRQTNICLEVTLLLCDNYYIYLHFVVVDITVITITIVISIVGKSRLPKSYCYAELTMHERSVFNSQGQAGSTVKTCKKTSQHHNSGCHSNDYKVVPNARLRSCTTQAHCIYKDVSVTMIV